MENKDKKIIDRCILWGLSKLNQWHLNRIEKYGTETIDNPHAYEVLLPDSNTDKKGYYSNPFTVALKTPKVNNIAITGAYGSGKSSFLRTFEKENAQWNFLPISLATFKDTHEDIEKKGEPNEENPPASTDITDESKDKSEVLQDIERSILQQFFYREKDSKIPYSRFKRIRNIQKKIIFYHSFVIGFLFLYGFSIFKTSKFIELFSSNFFVNHEYNYLSYLSVGILFYYLYRLFTYLWNIQISKFNFKKGEVSLAKQDKSSILNEHLDEILYFFEVTEYDVVLFEDIDRFDDTEIFIKLRELNNLINNSKQIDRRVRFVYAIRDDMFVDKERTKFFDFIVPIIPYINPSNSEMKLIEKFKGEIKAEKIDESFISQVSLYIDDMRLLINIYNEYMVYKNNLNSEKLKHTQILALVICKNFYPLDFAKLHVRDGIIYDLFANKPIYIKEKVKELNNEKRQINKSINNIEEEDIQSLDELKMIYLGTIFSKLNADAVTINNHAKQSLNNLLTTDILDKITNDTMCQGLIKASSHYSNYPPELRNNGNITFGEIQKLIHPKFTYLQRKSFIKNKSSNQINELKKEIENIDKKILKLKQATLQELFKTSSSIIIEGYENKDLLIFLVRNGYIDEHYEHYISYFHKGGITQDDREFLLSIQNYNALDFTFKLGNIPKLLEKLKDEYFRQIQILNFDLIDFLLNNYNDYLYKADILFKKISKENELAVKFIFSYLEYTSNSSKKEFIKRLQWNNIWLHIYNNFSTDKQNEYFSLIFQALEADEIIAFNVDDSLKEYLEKQTNLPKYLDTKNKKCQELISELELEFSDIKNPSDNEELFNYIYKNWNYELSETMMKIMLSEKADISMDDLAQAHFTTIRGSRAKELIEYIDTNIDEYVENIFLVIESNTKESEETVLYLLNSDEVSFENKVKILQKEEVKISDINSVGNKELWIELFKDNKIEATWDNVMYYYINNDNTLDNDLIGFLSIEENAFELSKVRIDKTYCENNEDFNTQILREIIELNKFDISSYEYLIKNLGYWYKNLDISTLNEEKIVLLVKYNRFQFESECFDTLKKYTNSQHLALVEKNKNKFLEKFDEFAIDEDDLILLLQSDEFEIEEKFLFIEKSNLSNIEEKVSVKEVISKLYIDNAKYIENINIFDKLFYGENKYDLELLILQIPYLEDCESCKKYLLEFTSKLDELLEISNKSLYIENNIFNKKLLEELKKKDCISSFSEEDSILHRNKLKVNRKRG